MAYKPPSKHMFIETNVETKNAIKEYYPSATLSQGVKFCVAKFIQKRPKDVRICDISGTLPGAEGKTPARLSIRISPRMSKTLTAVCNVFDKSDYWGVRQAVCYGIPSLRKIIIPDNFVRCIEVNSVKCTTCNEVLVSHSPKDTETCECERVTICGGRLFLGVVNTGPFEQLSTTAFISPYNARELKIFKPGLQTYAEHKKGLSDK